MTTTTPPRTNNSTNPTRIRAIIFDVDDCLYDVSTGFTQHRNGDIVHQYMVDHFQFETLATAKAVRDEYFHRYHSTAKALTVAQQDGKFPPSPQTPTFETDHLAQYWVEHLNYELLWRQPKPTEEAAAATTTMAHAKARKRIFHDALKYQLPPEVRLIAFSNGPKRYVTKVLHTLGLWDLFGSSSRSGRRGGAGAGAGVGENDKDDDNNTTTDEDTETDNDGKYVFGVDDVLPYCKPEKEAFQIILDTINQNQDSKHPPIRPEECIMVEDSMKNIRSAKALGMHTILITGTKQQRQQQQHEEDPHRLLVNDQPIDDDPAVDVAVEMVEQIIDRLPKLFTNKSNDGAKKITTTQDDGGKKKIQSPAIFEP